MKLAASLESSARVNDESLAPGVKARNFPLVLGDWGTESVDRFEPRNGRGVLLDRAVAEIHVRFQSRGGAWIPLTVVV